MNTRRITFRALRLLAVALAIFNWVIPATQIQAIEPARRATSATPTARPLRVHDIALEPGGRLRGRVLNTEGSPTSEYQIIVVQDGRQVGTAVTDGQGRFAVHGIHGGMFQVIAGATIYACRGWAPQTAPPVATTQLLVVPRGIIQRGQRPFRDLFFGDPVMVGLVIAAAIAIPIAVGRSRSEPPAGS